jgi:hypothetical protein
MIDKKKTYLKPRVEVADMDVESINIICTSVVASGDATLSTDGFEDEGDYDAGEVWW